ncbi:hypothetical protein [Dyella silvatica]|uniref:hypothetical protein n=1 Tax=Dyella silvatica TaxID=2992128 RepID=UPI00224D490C|nr:hypothetical protein [Dyella silvatica]
MTYKYPTYVRQHLEDAVKHQHEYIFTLATWDVIELGVFNDDDQAQIRDGGRFDLTPWRKSGPRQVLTAPTTAHGILLDASHIAGHLYLQMEPGAGNAGAGEISAMYVPHPPSTTATRTVHVEPLT